MSAPFDLDSLLSAWEHVLENAGCAGADGLTVERFAHGAEGRLERLLERVLSGGYRPYPLLKIVVEKKPGSAKTRTLLVPAVGDRVLQTAVARHLSRSFEEEFLECSFGYRPGRSVDRAIARIRSAASWGTSTSSTPTSSIIFDNISHSLLFARLQAELGPRSPLLAWIRSWTAAVAWDGQRLYSIPVGVPQGSPLSPLLANYFLDPFDKRLRAGGLKLVRYADDFVVLARTPFELPDARALVVAALADLQLELNEEKTRFTDFEKGFRFLGAEIHGDSIMLPFKVKKTVKKPDFVAPRMSSALIRAYRSGHLRVCGVLKWTGEPVCTDETPGAPRASAEPTEVLDLLRFRPTSCGALTSSRVGVD